VAYLDPSHDVFDVKKPVAHVQVHVKASHIIKLLGSLLLHLLARPHPRDLLFISIYNRSFVNMMPYSYLSLTVHKGSAEISECVVIDLVSDLAWKELEELTQRILWNARNGRTPRGKGFVLKSKMATGFLVARCIAQHTQAVFQMDRISDASQLSCARQALKFQGHVMLRGG